MNKKLNNSLKPGKFVCPPGFEPVDGRAILNLEDVEDEDTELWIIQTPAGVNMKQLANHPINLQGSTQISLDDTSAPNFECFSSKYKQDDEHGFHMLVPRKSDNKLVCVPRAFKGHMVITEHVNTANLNVSLGRAPYEIVETESSEADESVNVNTEVSARHKKKKKTHKTVEPNTTEELISTSENEQIANKKTENSHSSKRKRKKFKEAEQTIDSSHEQLFDTSIVKEEPCDLPTTASDISKSSDATMEHKPEKKKKKHKKKEQESLPNIKIKTEPDLISSMGLEDSFGNTLGNDESTGEVKKKKKRKLQKEAEELADIEIKREPQDTFLSENLSKKVKKKRKKHEDD